MPKEGDELTCTKLKEFITHSDDDKKIKLIKFTKDKEFSIQFDGKIKDMRYNKNFEETVLEFIKEQREFNKEQRNFNKKVNARLENIELRLDVLESLPIIKKELQLEK